MILTEQWLIVTEKYKTIAGDIDAKFETNTKEDFKSMGSFGTWEINEREDRLIKTVEEHRLVIANMLFQKPENRYSTGESPDGETRNQIYLALCNHIGTVTIAK